MLFAIINNKADSDTYILAPISPLYPINKGNCI